MSKPLRYIVVLLCLLGAPVTANAQFLKSTPLWGPAPATAVPQLGVNDTTPIVVYLSPYSQGNIQVQLGKGVHDFYGGGAVDGEIDSNSVKIIESGNIPDSAVFDVDGNGVVNDSDAILIQKYLDGQISYLPAYAFSNPSAPISARISWLEKIMAKTSSLPAGYQTSWNWLCQNITTWLGFNSFGVSDPTYSFNQYKDLSGIDMSKVTTNALYNLKWYTANDFDMSGGAHAVVGVCVGNVDTTFSSWYFFYGDDKNQLYQVKPGDVNMNPDSTVSIGTYAYFKGPHSPTFNYISPLVKFKQINGEWKMIYHDPSLVIDNPIYMQVSVGDAPDSVAVNGGDLESKVALTPQNLESRGFNAIPGVTADSTKLTPNLSYTLSDTTWSPDSTSMLFYAKYYGWLTSGGVTKVDSISQKITLANLINLRITEVHVGTLDSITVNGSTIPDGQALTPSYLQGLGYKAIPDTTKDSTDLPIHLRYTDRDTTWTSDSSYTFKREFFASLVSYGDSVVDSTSQVISVDHLTAIENRSAVPTSFALYQNFPNPFNPTTVITYDIAKRSHVMLTVYDVLGRQVATLVNAEKSPGEYQAIFDASELPSGVYFYRIQAGNYTAVKKLMLVK